MIFEAILIPKIYARLQEIASNFSKFSGGGTFGARFGASPPYRAPFSKIPGSAHALNTFVFFHCVACQKYTMHLSLSKLCRFLQNAVGLFVRHASLGNWSKRTDYERERRIHDLSGR